MGYLNDVILCLILLLFPLMVYGFAISYDESNDTEEISLSIALLCSMYILLNRGYSMFPRIAMLLANIPILIHYIKHKHFTGIMFSFAYIFVCNQYFYIDLKIMILQYVILFILYIIYDKFQPNKYKFVINFFILKFLVYILFRHEPGCFFDDNMYDDALYISIPLSCLTCIIVIYLMELGEKIISTHLDYKEMKKEQELRTSLFKITHEIKNPLTVCRGYLKMLDPENSEKCSKYMPIINYEIEHALLILEDFSSLSKLKIIKKVFFIDELLQKTKENVTPMLNTLNIDFELETEENVMIYADYLRLNQVLINLLKNSYEVLENKENDKKISIKQYSDNKYIYIEVKDNGPGAIVEDLNRLGEPFYTTKPQGTGLGLTFSNEIIKAHDGNIKYENDNGLKITFSIKK